MHDLIKSLRREQSLTNLVTKAFLTQKFWVRPFFIINRRKRNKFQKFFYAHTRMYFHSNEIVFLFLQLALYFRLQKWNIGNPKTTPLSTRIKIHFDCTYFLSIFFFSNLFSEKIFQHTSERRKRGGNFRNCILSCLLINW